MGFDAKQSGNQTLLTYNRWANKLITLSSSRQVNVEVFPESGQANQVVNSDEDNYQEKDAISMSNMTTMTSVAEQYNQDDSCSDDEELKPGES